MALLFQIQHLRRAVPEHYRKQGTMSSDAQQHSSDPERHVGADSAAQDEPMPSRVKPLAVGCKIFASVEGLASAWFLIGSWYFDMHSATPPRDAPLDWGTPAYYHRTYLWIAVVGIVALLVTIPNRWLVSSRLLFGIVLIVSLLPLLLVWFFMVQDLLSVDFMTAYFLPFIVLLSGLWPASLCLSLWRHRKGQRFLYA